MNEGGRVNQRSFQDPPGALARKHIPVFEPEEPEDVEVVYEEEKPKTSSVSSKAYTTATGTLKSLYTKLRVEAQQMKNLNVNINPKNGMISLLLLCVVLEVFMKTHGANSPYNTNDGTTTEEKRDLASSSSNFVSKLPANSPLLSTGQAVSSVPANTKPKRAPSKKESPPANNNNNKPPAQPETKLQRIIRQNNPNRKIVYVHTGKAGGDALRTNVAAKCTDYYPNYQKDEKQKKLHLECQARFPPTNKIANQTRHVVHLRHSDPQALQDATSFMFGLRNPMDRIHDVYRYTHPANCRKTLDKANEKNYGCWALDHGRMEPGQLYYRAWKECFPSPNMEDFAQALLPPFEKANPHFIAKGLTHEQQTSCRQLARDLVLGGGGKDPTLEQAAPHMFFNYKFYADATMHQHADKEVFVLRAESEYEDMVALDKAMGGSGVFPHAKDKIPSDGRQHYMPSTLSDQAMHKLCCVLEEEIRHYFYIFDKAANVDQHDRGPTSQAFRDQCGIPERVSWSDWMHDCETKKLVPVE